MCHYNCSEREQRQGNIFPLKSFLNHDPFPNARLKYVTNELVFVYASKDIEAGEEILIDYCPNLKELKSRNKYLDRFKIIELDLDDGFN